MRIYSLLSPQSGLSDFWWVILVFVFLNKVLEAGRAQFWEGFSSDYFTLFSPRSGPRTIREQVGTSVLVLVGFWSIHTLPGRQVLFFPVTLRSYERTGKNQTS